MKRPRVRIINHVARDEGPVAKKDEEGSMLPFSQRQAYNEALKHFKRMASVIPESVTTQGEAEGAKRCLINARQELVVALRLLSEGE